VRYPSESVERMDQQWAESEEERSARLRRKRLAVAHARTAWGGKWPDQLTSGVMFYEGERITREQFEAQ
jgi:hypothetical protein